MTGQKPWTAVFSSSKSQGEHKIVNVTAGHSFKDAQKSVKLEHPGWTLVALIPGTHAERSYAISRWQVKATDETIPW